MWLPCSSISPLFKTIILSTSTIVDNLFSINIDVFSFEILSTDFCINCSVFVSIFAVASSSTNIAGSCANILANANNCFSPAEYEFPLSLAISSIPCGNEFIKSSADDNFIISSIYSSDKFSSNPNIVLYTFCKYKWIL